MIKNTRCRVTIGSITYATKAQKALSSAAIYSEIIKLDSQNFGKGCTYGLEFSCAQGENVKTVLRSAGIKHNDYIQI